MLATSIVSLLFSQFLADVQHKHQTQEADPNGSFTRQPAFLNLNPFKESGIQQTCCCATYGRVSDLGRQMMLCTTVLYCTVLYCTVLYCTVLYCVEPTVLYCTVSNLLSVETELGTSSSEMASLLIQIYKVQRMGHSNAREAANMPCR